MPNKIKNSGTIGYALQLARTLKGCSLRQAAKDAKITPTYLKKLEDDGVKEPSPNILYRLSIALDIPYSDLMKQAGYVVPNNSEEDSSPSDALAIALRSANLTADELKHMVEYLALTKKNRS